MLSTSLRSLLNSLKIHKFEPMQIEADIGFNQLLKIAKTLPSAQLKQLKAELEKQGSPEKSEDLQTLLLKGPRQQKSN